MLIFSNHKNFSEYSSETYSELTLETLQQLDAIIKNYVSDGDYSTAHDSCSVRGDKDLGIQACRVSDFMICVIEALVLKHSEEALEKLRNISRSKLKPLAWYIDMARKAMQNLLHLSINSQGSRTYSLVFPEGLSKYENYYGQSTEAWDGHFVRGYLKHSGSYLLPELCKDLEEGWAMAEENTDSLHAIAEFGLMDCYTEVTSAVLPVSGDSLSHSNSSSLRTASSFFSKQAVSDSDDDSDDERDDSDRKRCLVMK